jgi:hypothetical protein
MATEPSTAQSFEFAVSEPPTLVVRNPIGTVITQTGTASRVSIGVTKRITGLLFGGNGLDAMEKVTVTAEQDGSTIRVNVHHPKQTFSTKAVTVDLEITVPERAELDLHVDAGNIELRGGTGVARAQVDAGNIRAEGYTFLGVSRIAVDAGNATLDAALGADASLDVSVDAGNARLRLPPATSTYLDAAIDAGSLKIAGWNVEIKHEMVSHKARGPLGPNPRGTLRVRVDAGTINIGPNA